MSATTMHPAVFRSLQARFLTIPQAPLCYWLRERFFELLAGRTLAESVEVREGITTTDNERFLRYHWEQPEEGTGWLPVPKGGAYVKWAGLELWVLDWRDRGARLRSLGKATLRNLRYWAKPGWTYTQMARGAMGVRVLPKGCALEHKGPAVFGKSDASVPGAILNNALSSFVLRVLNQGLEFRTSSVERLPLLERIPEAIRGIEAACIALKRVLVAHELTEPTFRHALPVGATLREAHTRATEHAEAIALVLHTLEGLSEHEVFAAYRIEGEDLLAVLDETGTPAGWFPLIGEYDAIPQLPNGIELPEGLLAPLAREPRRTLSAQDLAGLKRRLRALYEAGPGAKMEDDEAAAGVEDEDEENESAVSGARIPIPAETFLEEISQKLEVHPISVYLLLRELREQEGVVCQLELRRFVEDYASVLVLRLLGHRRPRQIESGEPLPAWADTDGIMPITEGTGEPTLLERVRERIAEEFGPDRVNPIEQEFEQITGKPLATWLATEFFPRHLSQFKKRPIAWHIESSRASARRGRRGRGNAVPAFSCLAYYHRVDADLLPKLRSQYVGPLGARFQTELAGLEKLEHRTPDQDERRVRLEMLLEELKNFDARLEQVITGGFSSDALARLAAKEPLDKWTSGDGEAPHPMTRETFLAQERKYEPDLNDGVRVNIAPLQKASLLAVDVLAAKDVEKAIADRAEWRADERRWCHAGKLPQPGWWPPVATAQSAAQNRGGARR